MEFSSVRSTELLHELVNFGDWAEIPLKRLFSREVILSSLLYLGNLILRFVGEDAKVCSYRIVSI